MLRRSYVASVRFYPQVQLGYKTQFAKPIDDQSSTTALSPSSVEDVADLRKRLDWRLWNAMAEKDWNRWESVMGLYEQHKLPMDEVSFTLVLHGYLLSHHHPASVALLVLERMRSDNIHASVIQLNENLVNSFFELSDMGIKSSSNGWQNLARLAWMSAARLRKQRMKRVREHLKSLPTRDVLALSEHDVTKLIESEHELAKALVCDDDLQLLEH